MSADQVLMYARKAKRLSSADNQIELLIKALEQAGQAIRELESKVRSLDNG